MGNSEVFSVHIPLSDVAQPEHKPQIDLDTLIQEVELASRQPGVTVLIHGDHGLNQKQRSSRHNPAQFDHSRSNHSMNPR